MFDCSFKFNAWISSIRSSTIFQLRHQQVCKKECIFQWFPSHFSLNPSVSRPSPAGPTTISSLTPQLRSNFRPIIESSGCQCFRLNICIKSMPMSDAPTSFHSIKTLIKKPACFCRISVSTFISSPVVLFLII